MATDKNIIERGMEMLSGILKRNTLERYQPGADRFSAWKLVNTYSFNGEKNLGEIGPIKNYSLNYEALRMRSWQAYLESEIFKTIIEKFALWVVAYGLKLQSKPNKVVLESEGIDIDSEKFNEITEARFTVWAQNKMCDYSNTNTLGSIAKTAFLNAKIGGDVLVILRVIKGVLKIELIDGAHVSSPHSGTDEWSAVTDKGNLLRNGVEYSPKKEIVAFWVQDAAFKYSRVEAKNKTTGLLQAYLVSGQRFRLDNYRGIPVMSTVLETIKKLERYKEATLGSAEEQAKVAFQIVHGTASTGESPLIDAMAKARGEDADLPKSDDGTNLASTVAATTNKQVFNNTQDSEIKTLSAGTGQLYFKDFYETNTHIMCSAIGIPPNVALSIYNDSFSASRAALKDWEHVINVSREDFTAQFYAPIYQFFLHLEILKGKIQAPGYLTAYYEGNEMALAAYQSSRFRGPIPGHIDPLKEVKAVRAKLGPLADGVPLITIEQAVEELNGDDSDGIMEQFSEELEMSKELGLQYAAKGTITIAQNED
jgi:capsid protein